MIPNPFRPTRWEHHGDGYPLIWFTPTAEQLAREKSSYVHGSRGSGKTSLLKSICWEDLTCNPSLKLQHSIGDFRSIGIYIRFPDHVSDSMGRLDWAALFPNAPDPVAEQFRFFSLAVELICLEKALTAVHQLRLETRLSFDAAQELRLVGEVVEEYGALKFFLDRRANTFLDLARLFRNVVRFMNEASGQGLIGPLLPMLPKREPAELLHFVTERISGISRLDGVNSSVSPGFKFCLDDCEVLRKQQLMSINTLVRKSRFPVSWVITAVGDALDNGETFVPQQPLTDADRKVISLDDRRRTDFGSLCEAVASLRTYFSLPSDKRPTVNRREIAKFFHLERRLGKQDVNDTIRQMLRRSSSAEGVVFLEAANYLRDLLWEKNISYKRKYPKEEDRLPLYEAYLLLHWTGVEESFADMIDPQNFERIKQSVDRLKTASFQAWMRRKMVAALLHLADRLGFKRLPLAGANRVISLSDGSIRDFLEILADIFDAYVTQDTADPDMGTHFALSGSKIATRLQTGGIYAASESFFAGVSTNTETHPELVVSLIEIFGRLTSALQTNASDTTTLGTAERGVFIVDLGGDLFFRDAQARDRQSLFEAIKQAEVSGYLRPVDVRRGGFAPREKELLTGYRLHRRFSPLFRFSYRGAYEAVTIDGAALSEICARSSSSRGDSWKTLLTSRPQSSSVLLPQLPWPDELLDD